MKSKNKLLTGLTIIAILLIGVFFNTDLFAIVLPSTETGGTFVMKQDKSGLHQIDVTVSIDSFSAPLEYSEWMFSVWGPDASTVEYAVDQQLQIVHLFGDGTIQPGASETKSIGFIEASLWTAKQDTSGTSHPIVNNDDYHILVFIKDTNSGAWVPLRLSGSDIDSDPSGVGWRFEAVECIGDVDCTTSGYGCESNSCVLQEINGEIEVIW